MPYKFWDKGGLGNAVVRRATVCEVRKSISFYTWDYNTGQDQVTKKSYEDYAE